MEYQKLPKWFDGVVYKNYETVQNPFSGEQIKLNPNEVAMYDLCKGAEMLGQWTLLNKCYHGLGHIHPLHIWSCWIKA